MPEITNDEKEIIEQKLEYIGLDLENVPEFLKSFKPLNYRPLESYDDTYKIYKYINICDIQILITPTDRLTSLQEKYKLASPILEYLDSENEEDIEKFAKFLEMVKNLKIDDIEEIETEQELLKDKIPFEVKYKNNFIWQIYYSDYCNKYFMLVPTREANNPELFYILKQQIQCNKEKGQRKIFVPISNMEYSERYLKKTEINDIENYLWYFTKQWPNIYEVYDNDENLEVQILGQVDVYEKVLSTYKIKIKKETATKGLIVILFISVFTGLLTPLGTTPYTYLVKTMQGNTTNNISEHLPLTLINNIPIMVVLVMFLVILIFTDTKIKLRDLFMLSGLVLLAFMTRRQTSLLVLIGSFIFSKLVASMFEKYAPEAKNELLSALNNKKVDAIVILLVIIMSLGMYSGKIGNSFVSKKNYPVEATEWILQNLDVKNIKLFNEYNYGSYLLYKGVPVFIDSRADLYAPEFNGKRAENGEYDGRDIFTDFIKTSSMERYYEDTFEKYDITHIILKKKSKLNTFISNDSGFLEMYNDDNFVVYERCK